MNAIVEKPTGKLTPVKDPELVVLAQKALIAELKRENRALRKELKDERRHTVDMLAIMRRSAGVRAFFQNVARGGCQCDECTCTPTRSEMLRGR